MLRIHNKGVKIMKRVLAAFLIGVMSISGLSVSAAAYNDGSKIVVVKDANGSSKISLLYIINREATCNSTYFESEKPVKSIKGVQTLEKKNSYGGYSSVSGATWTKTVNSKSLQMNNTKSNLATGTYRLKTVFTATLSNGSTETTTVYSTVQTAV